MAKLKDIKTDKVSSKHLFEFTYKILQAKSESDKKSCWIKKDFEFESFTDLCFSYKNQVYSVLIDLRDKSGETQLSDDTIKQQLSFSEQNEIIPCVFPVEKLSDDKFRLIGNDWNLYNTETNKPVNPDNYAQKSKKEISDFGLNYLGINFIKEYLTSKNNDIISIQDVSKEEPDIWFYDDLGHKSYIILHNMSIETDNSDEELTEEIINKYKNNDGYEIAICLSSSGKNKKIYYGDKVNVEIKYNIRINKAPDTIKSEEPLENEDIYSLIAESSKTKNISDKKSIKIYYLKDYENYVLKTQAPLISNLDIITDELVLIPYKYDNNIKNNPHYGLPLYYVTSKSSKYSTQKYIDPHDESIINKPCTNILKRIFGQNITQNYRYQFFTLYGELPDKQLALELKKVVAIKDEYGITAAEKVINQLKKGIYDFPLNQLKKGSRPFRFIPNNNFSIIYESFVENYLSTLKLLSEFPQKSYNNAIECITEEKNFVFDFSTPSNIIVDFDESSFNFINFIFDKSIINKTAKEKQLEQFKNSILGLYENILIQPKDILYLKSDIAEFKQYEKLIIEKYKNAVSNI